MFAIAAHAEAPPGPAGDVSPSPVGSPAAPADSVPLPPLPEPAPASSVAEPAPVLPAPEAGAQTPAELLGDGTRAVELGQRDRARTIYRRLGRARHAGEERRALGRLLGLPESEAGAAGTYRRGRPSGRSTDEVYSTKTLERVRARWWETVDFVATAAGYGLGMGLAFDLGPLSDTDAGGGAVALMPFVYAGVAGLLLGAAEPDRGDLPLVLTILGDVPLSALLASVALDVEDGTTAATTVAISGALALPVAWVAADGLTLDPGSVQLVRDAGFWGLVLGAAGMAGFGASVDCSGSGLYESCEVSTPSGPAVALAGLIGLYAGLGLGAAGAGLSDVSYDRVRLATLGGYVGLLVGATTGAQAWDDDRAFRGVAVGGAAGFLLTLAFTDGLDEVPPGARMTDAWAAAPSPTVVALKTRGGGEALGLGLGWRF